MKILVYFDPQIVFNGILFKTASPSNKSNDTLGLFRGWYLLYYYSY